MRKFLILLGILFFLVAQTQAAETAWRHSGFEVWGFDLNFSNNYSLNNVKWINGTNLNVSTVQQDLNFNNKNISQVELVNNVNFSDFAKAANHEITIINDTGTAKAFWNGSLLYSGAAQTVMNSSTLLLQNVGGTVKLSCGNFSNIDSVYSYDNVVIEGSGNCTQIRASPNTNSVFYIKGTVPTLIGTIQSNVALGDQIITLDTTSGLAPDDYILLNSSRVTSYLSQKYGDIHRIKSLTATTITIDSARMNYSTGDTAKVYKMNYISNAEYRNFKIEGLDAASSKIGFEIRYSKDIVIDNINIEKIGTAGIILYSSLNVEIKSSSFKDAAVSGSGYGISISDASMNIKIHDNNFINQTNHATTTGGTGNDGLPKFIYIYNNDFNDAVGGDCSDEHFGDYVFYSDNTYKNCGQIMGAENVIIDGNKYYNATGAIQARASTGILRNLTIKNVDILRGDAGTPAIFFDVITPLRLTINNVEIRDYPSNAIYVRNIGSQDFRDPIVINNLQAFNLSGNAKTGIYFDITSTGKIYNIDINNVYIDGATGNGIQVDSSINTTITDSRVKNINLRENSGSPYGIFVTATNAIIERNIVQNFRRYGITISASNSSICYNTVSDSRHASGDQGIRLVSVSNSTICNNIIYNMSVKTPVAEVTSGNNNTIKNNVFEVGSTVTLLGTTTTEVIGNTNVGDNIMRIPICSNTILNVTQSTCWNRTSGALNIFNGTRWNWAANGTETI